MNYLVDTNVISELVRPRPNPAVDRWMRSRARIEISAVTVEEIAFGLSWRPRPRVQEWFSRFFAQRCVIHAIDEDVARRCGQLRGQLQALGESRTQADMLVAATASLSGMTVVTRNMADFAGCGVDVLNPFD